MTVRLWLMTASVALVYPLGCLADDTGCPSFITPFFRLACYEQKTAQTGSAAECRAKSTDDLRLACYDAASVRSVPGQALAAPPPAPVERVGFKPIRLELGDDYAVGQYSGVLKTLGGQTRLQSAFGGSGSMMHAGLWWDGIGWRWLSLGLDHVSLSNQIQINAAFPNGAIHNSSAETAVADAKLRGEISHLNVAARSQTGSWRPYVSLGVGGGRGWVQGGYDLEGFVTGDGQFKNSSWVGDFQSSFGFDWVPLSWLKIGPEARAMWFTARPFGFDQEYINLGIGLNLAAQF